jgi:hypothetical protein
MHKVKHALAFAVVTTGLAGSLMLASSASAATVTHQILSPGPPESFYACNFPLIASFSGTVQMTKIDNEDSLQLIFTPIGPQTITVTNPANGKSITGIGPNSPSGEIVRRPPERDLAELRASRGRRRPPGDRKRQLRRRHLQRSRHARRHNRVLQLPGRPVGGNGWD